VILRRFAKQTDGSTAVEFGLTAPVFLAVLFGVIELGMLFWTQLGLQHAAELTARCASINKTICGTDTAIKGYASSKVFGLTVPTSTWTVSQPACGSQINADYDFAFVASFFGAPSWRLTASACFPK
jgi:Flp pilus assembly protein TadG